MKEEIKIFLEKVPALHSKGKAIITLMYVLSFVGIIVLYFYFFNQIAWYMPIITQSLMALIVILIGYFHTKKAEHYREKYGRLAYQKYFYRYIIPLLITWYALFFHPLFVTGQSIFPIWIFPSWTPILLAIILFIMFMLVNLHIERAGFKMMTNGMDIYSIFPEEAPIVRGKIYSYIRHPLYLSLTLGCFSLAFLVNNYIAMICGFIQLIPCIFMGKIEDKELITRDGSTHMDYINDTAMIFPIRRIGGFLKLIFLLK
ncbi:MAG: hypothetical protein GF317_17880 [Candidatus Lokiarchaeota archaeon]|nr:hypothetical protein [Candidatus Lokiarchaeota archaeon]MBD3201383.1 hypothetical protein [Candidatus Lokiarchaeota archaeon]